MAVSRFPPHPSALPCLRLALSVVLAASAVQAQTKASCTFNFFKPSGISRGVNDWGTTVGAVKFKAAIRYVGGGIVYYLPPGALVSSFVGRNNKGVTIGEYGDAAGNRHEFMLKGSTFTEIVIPKAVPNNTTVFGINKWNSTVGWYMGSDPTTAHGFKRYSNGGFIKLDYPFTKIPGLGQATYPSAINDSGVVVGSYDEDTEGPEVHGFIYHNGQWATLDAPNALRTYLVGISNAGVIVAQTDYGASFLYSNGTFKLINVPNSDSTTVEEISPGGLIVGHTLSQGFTAICH